MQFATAADYAACRALLRDGSRTFHAASFLLPRQVREPACALYAFCRVADDAVDTSGRGVAALDELHLRLEAVYLGQPASSPVDRAFADVVHRYAIPRTLPDALLEGFAWDLAGRRYHDLPALEDYAARVAGSVGAMMALLMGVRSAAAIARACDLGVAMQLSNIARDVGEDARAGRLYLPLSWLQEAGVDPHAWLSRPQHDAAVGQVVARLLRSAERLYARVGDGIAALPLNCRPGINAARTLYAEIGREVERQGYDGVNRRAVVSARRKAAGLVQALATVPARGAVTVAEPLPATRYLVDAVVTGSQPPVPTLAIPWWNFAAQISWSLELFEQLERRQSTGAAD